ncbi:hypothetical protein [Actinoplanes xinjiangensis]|jgi:hypothetical protein|uniref:Uncharacterized protein n=1 Tax=Actinoplanes xinjiangensis TaxID=512350 RepID=A0A316FBJ6_9ACTN|nr:hypothetical protein [Actinoplanes xinjiangensis]PWK44266.1 hypothetical protein BC793_112141 [Actinoplanes xinjiangensis]GIF37978.1 hypothetical protein Axi01nite_22890 [Actinoplanes xinjiangensis]
MAERKATIPSLVIEAWRAAPRVLRRLAIWMWAIGFPVGALLIVADLRGWWDGYQFIPNIAAEVLSGMLTLPIALVIIGQLAEYQVKALERERLHSRFVSTRRQLVTAARITREQIEGVTRDVEASTNEFVRAAKIDDGQLVDPIAANAAAHTLHTQMDGRQWLMYERIMTPLRILGSHLQTLLLERDRDGDLTEETTRFARLWLDLESALAAQHQIMTIGQNLFGQQPALYPRSVAKADRLRDVAVEHVRTIDRLTELCRELEDQAGGEQPALTR